MKILFQAQEDHPHVCAGVYIYTAEVHKVGFLLVALLPLELMGD